MRVLVNCFFGKPRAKQPHCVICGKPFEIISTSKLGKQLKNPYYKNINSFNWVSAEDEAKFKFLPPKREGYSTYAYHTGGGEALCLGASYKGSLYFHNTCYTK